MTILKAQVSFFNRLREKLLKARSSNIYNSKSQMKYYNFCQ